MKPERDELRCKCGGAPAWLDEGPMVDRLGCPACGLRTMPYFDGREYAEHDWRHNRNLRYGDVP